VVTQLAYNPANGHFFTSDGTNLLDIDVNTGATNSSYVIHTPLSNGMVSLSGMAFDATGHLYGVATLNNQNPVNQVGQITTTGDQLRCLAVSANGTIFAIDSKSGIDKLVTIDPTTGAEHLVGIDGIIRDSHADVFAGNITALAFDKNGNLLALTNDLDGTGSTFTTANGYGLGKINYTTNDYLRLSSVLSSNLTGDALPVFSTTETASATTPISSMAVMSNGSIYVVENFPDGSQRLDTLGTTSTRGILTAVDTITINGSNSHLIGIGFDENDTLIGMNHNTNSAFSELVGINATAPTMSVMLDAEHLLAQSYGGFAVGKSGAHFATYAYTTNATTGGMFFVNPGMTATLGTIDTADGSFIQLLPLARNTTGAPLAGNAISVAVDASGNIFTITDQGVLAKYSSTNGQIIGGQPLGVVKDQNGIALNVTRIAFNAAGDLIGLSTTDNNLVRIQTTTTVVNGENVVLATDVTEQGTADASDLTGLTFATSLDQALSFSTASHRFVALRGTTPETVGGVIANSIGTASLPNAFAGHIGVTGGGGVTVNGIDSIKFNGTAGAFTGSISVVNSIGAVTGTGVTFNGSLVTHADLNSATLTGTIAPTAVIAVDGKVNTFTLTGDFAGRLTMYSGGTFTVKGNVLDSAYVGALYDLATVSISGSDAGVINLGSNSKTFTLTGTLSSTGLVTVLGTAGAIALNGGTDLGSLFLAKQGATSVTVGGTLKGVVAARMCVTNAKLNNVTSGIFSVGGDLTSLTVSGSVSNSILAIGTWVGNDGVYNTADDVIYGGSLLGAKISGVFTDSLITAGVLPRQGVAAGTNNIPTDFTVYDYNATASAFESIDSAEAGGIRLSYIQNVSFAKAVVTSFPGSDIFAGLVAANGISKIGSAANTRDLKLIVRKDPAGAPVIVLANDPVTMEPVPIVRVNESELQVVFSEPLDTTTLNSSTIQVVDNATDQPITDLTFGYERQTAADGSIQSVLKIFSSSHFNDATNLTIFFADGTAQPWITDGTGNRSALLDYNQDGTSEPDLFGTPFVGGVRHVGVPNDYFAQATPIEGYPVTGIQGNNQNATMEPDEPSNLGSTVTTKSVWYSWVAPFTGSVRFDTIGSSFDTTLGIYTGTSLTNLIRRAYDDQSARNNQSRIIMNVTAGTQYWISISSYQYTVGGAYVLNIR
jgi:hypothetical protein